MVNTMAAAMAREQQGLYPTREALLLAPDWHRFSRWPEWPQLSFSLTAEIIAGHLCTYELAPTKDRYRVLIADRITGAGYQSDQEGVIFGGVCVDPVSGLPSTNLDHFVGKPLQRPTRPQAAKPAKGEGPIVRGLTAIAGFFVPTLSVQGLCGWFCSWCCCENTCGGAVVTTCAQAYCNGSVCCNTGFYKFPWCCGLSMSADCCCVQGC
jgi:hypothetical protein